MEYGFFDSLTLLGSLGLFLYGMKVMSDALVNLAGDKMRAILAASTSNRFFAVLTGFFITAVIQSSSATTLMVISFVNANLLTLAESVGVIMGANIGTTVTAWLISILGFKVKMSALAIPIVGLGFLLSLSKQENRKNTGLFLVGFAILFIGLEFLKDSVPDISQNPSILEFLQSYTNHGYLSIILFIFIGTVLTLVVQSSSATMALTILMTYEGWISFDIAVAMVIGQNVGTTITALLAALVANYQAKRAAFAHLIFNAVGVIWILILFYPFTQYMAQWATDLTGHSPYDDPTSIPIALSLFHTVFNILNAVFLIGFLQLIVRIVTKVIPEKKEKQIEIAQPKYLKEEFLDYSQTGIKAISDESVRLLENTAYKVIAHSMNAHRSDLESDKTLNLILKDTRLIPIDIDAIYQTQVKTIYTQIVDYATMLQTQQKLDEDQIESIRNILIANRKLVHILKHVKPLRKNINSYLDSDNLHIRKEYNKLRHRILKVTRLIHYFSDAVDLDQQSQFDKLKKQKSKLQDLDVLRTGHIDKLRLNGDISNDMAISLINDSIEAVRLTELLIDVAHILYEPRDQLVEQIEQNILINQDN